MIVLPWYIRFGIDCVLIATPLLYLHNHPTTHLLQSYANKRRIVRRRSIQNQQQIFGKSQNSPLDEQAVKKLYKDLNIAYP